MMLPRADHVWPWLRAALCAPIVVFLIAPMVIVVIVSFSSAHFLTFPPPGLSLQWYRKLFSSPAWIDTLIDQRDDHDPERARRDGRRHGGRGRRWRAAAFPAPA